MTSDPGTARRLTIRPFNFGERDAMPDTYGDGYCRVRRYAVIGSNLLQIQPMESAQGDYSVYYVPKPAVLTLDTDELDDELEPWAEYVALEAAVKALVKEESYEQANDLRAQIKVIREDMAAAVQTDESPTTVTNVNNRGRHGL